MKGFFYISLLVLLSSCNRKNSEKKADSHPGVDKKNIVLKDGVLTFEYQNDFKDKNIHNQSEKKVDLLFNNIDKYLGGKNDPRIRFPIEWITTELVYEYNGGLLFGYRLHLTNNGISYYQKNINHPKDRWMKAFTRNDEKKSEEFDLDSVKVIMKYQGISCNDADFNKVTLKFPSGSIEIDSLINASFFEFDMDADGKKEQYLFGVRNCSQEQVWLRIRE